MHGGGDALSAAGCGDEVQSFAASSRLPVHTQSAGPIVLHGAAMAQPDPAASSGLRNALLKNRGGVSSTSSAAAPVFPPPR